ncbi:MAG: hypothetical protein II131_04715, partial [Neisseriaceae bacterium]|nr:hypothetical protein [Neisseriaceae bacterium]
MIDEENPYAPPKSTLEDFRQPETMVKPTKMQRLVRVVLFPVLLPLIATVLWWIFHRFVSFFGLGEIRLGYFEYAYSLFLSIT